ncbi:MAG: hypothetical protein ACLU3D_06595 [Acutalibacteraceae bacterium]
MKKRILSLFTFLMLIFCFIVSASAASVVNTNEYIEYFSDGSYATTTIEESLVLTRGTVFLKSGNKVYTYWDAKGNEQFKVTLYGEFNVNSGVSATCIKSTINVNITNDNWKLISQEASKSGNQAKGTVTLKRYMLLIPVETREKTLTLTCDKNGTLS